MHPCTGRDKRILRLLCGAGVAAAELVDAAAGIDDLVLAGLAGGRVEPAYGAVRLALAEVHGGARIPTYK